MAKYRILSFNEFQKRKYMFQVTTGNNKGQMIPYGWSRKGEMAHLYKQDVTKEVEKALAQGYDFFYVPKTLGSYKKWRLIMSDVIEYDFDEPIIEQFKIY